MKWFAAPAALLLAFSFAGAAEEMSALTTLQRILEDKNGALSKTAQSFLGKDGGNSLFYFPTHDAPGTPKSWGYRYEDVTFRSADGTRLHGWFVPAGIRKPKGTVVFSHGNAGSLGHHLGFALWFVPEGYNVFFYDYRGFGQSQGDPDRAKMHEDVRAAFDYVKTRKDVNPQRLVSFGHSLGGAQSLATLGTKSIPGVKAVITEGAFASYRDMAGVVAGNVGRNITTDEWSPRDLVAKISPLPLLIVHGVNDAVVPLSQAKILYAAANKPKLLWEVPDATHGDALYRNNGEYRKKVVTWLASVMK